MRLFVAFGLVALLSACGSGAVSGPPPAAAPLAVTPSAATLYSESPTSFTLSGGTAPYFVTSSDQAAVPVVGTVEGTQFIVVPNPVAVETPVTLTVSDSASTAPATVALTVRPRIVSNVITVTPSASQSAACGSSICAGGDAEVAATLSLNGIPLAGRTVRFDVVSGEFRIITSAPGVAEATALTASTLSDATGTARMRVRVLTDASAQTALLQITDVSSGAFQRASVPISPASTTPLNAQPSQVSFVGPDATSCANGPTASIIVFGGRPPYLISRPGTFDISTSVVSTNGGTFTVKANGQCVESQPIAIVDNNRATVSVIASNSLGPVVPVVPLVVTPSKVVLDSCDSHATVRLAGGVGPPYFPAVGSGALDVDGLTTSLFDISRLAGSDAAASPVEVGFTDGQTTVSVTVEFEALGTGPC